jgi:purine-binding chemotaxis protein CheW
MNETDTTLGRDPDVISHAAHAHLPIEQYFVVRLAKVLHGFRASEVRRVAPATAPVRVPTAPALILGLVHLDGTILPVVDLLALFGLADPGDRRPETTVMAAPTGQRLVVLEASGRSFAFFGETVGLRDIAPDTIRPPLTPHASGAFIMGHIDVGRDVVTIVRADSILKALLDALAAMAEQEH